MKRDLVWALALVSSVIWVTDGVMWKALGLLAYGFLLTHRPAAKGE